MTLDELSAPFPAYYARHYALDETTARELASSVAAIYDEDFRSRIGVAIQFVVESLISSTGQTTLEKRLAALDVAIDYKNLAASIEKEVDGEQHHVAAVALASVLDHQFGARWRKRQDPEFVRAAQTLIIDGSRSRRGRPESVEINNFLTAVLEAVELAQGLIALPSNYASEIEPSPIVNLVHQCCERAIELGETVLNERLNGDCPPPLRIGEAVANDRRSNLRHSLGLTSRAIGDRLRKIL